MSETEDTRRSRSRRGRFYRPGADPRDRKNQCNEVEAGSQRSFSISSFS